MVRIRQQRKQSAKEWPHWAMLNSVGDELKRSAPTPNTIERGQCSLE